MKEVTVLKTEIGKLKDVDWLYCVLPDDNTLFVNDEKSVMTASKEWKMTPEAVEAIKGALHVLAETLIEHIEEDLKDIWEAIR